MCLPMSAPALKTSIPSPIPAGVVIAKRQASVGLSTAMNFDRFFSCGAMYASSGCKSRCNGSWDTAAASCAQEE